MQQVFAEIFGRDHEATPTAGEKVGECESEAEKSAYAILILRKLDPPRMDANDGACWGPEGSESYFLWHGL